MKWIHVGILLLSCATVWGDDRTSAESAAWQVRSEHTFSLSTPPGWNWYGERFLGGRQFYALSLDKKNWIVLNESSVSSAIASVEKTLEIFGSKISSASPGKKVAIVNQFKLTKPLPEGIGVKFQVHASGTPSSYYHVRIFNAPHVVVLFEYTDYETPSIEFETVIKSYKVLSDAWPAAHVPFITLIVFIGIWAGLLAFIYVPIRASIIAKGIDGKNSDR